jgi:beta-galactosidase
VSASTASNGSGEITIEYALGTGLATFTVTYAMTGDGSLNVTADFNPSRLSLPDPLRVGLAYTMPSSFTEVAWYGRGPHESYQDRKAGAALGRWHGTIAEQYHDYLRPQESGNKVDVRWMQLSQDNGTGLLIKGEQPLSMNVLAFPYDDLDRRPPGTRRSSDIVPREHVSLMVDAVQAGLGGDDTWSPNTRPHAQYRVPLTRHRFSFQLK